METIRPRYEFRVWGEGLATVRKSLELLAQPKTAESEETYLISRTTEKCNAKIRAALMDIKVLVAEDRGLQQWKPILKLDFRWTAPSLPTKSSPALSCLRRLYPNRRTS